MGILYRIIVYAGTRTFTYIVERCCRHWCCCFCCRCLLLSLQALFDIQKFSITSSGIASPYAHPMPGTSCYHPSLYLEAFYISIMDTPKVWGTKVYDAPLSQKIHKFYGTYPKKSGQAVIVNFRALDSSCPRDKIDTATLKKCINQYEVREIICSD